MRASIAFKLGDSTEAGNVMIENDRLKTSMDIVNNKLRSQADYDSIISSLKKKNVALESENEDLKN